MLRVLGGELGEDRQGAITSRKVDIKPTAANPALLGKQTLTPPQQYLLCVPSVGYPSA